MDLNTYISGCMNIFYLKCDDDECLEYKRLLCSFIMILCVESDT